MQRGCVECLTLAHSSFSPAQEQQQPVDDMQSDSPSTSLPNFAYSVDLNGLTPSQRAERAKAEGNSKFKAGQFQVGILRSHADVARQHCADFDERHRKR